MSSDNYATKEDIKEIREDIKSLIQDVGFIRGQLSTSPSKGAPIAQTSSGLMGLSLTDIATSKYGIFMGVSAVISALGAVLANFINK